MSERGEVKRTGSKATFNSGRSKHQKGDAIIGPFVYDIKEYSKGYTISFTNWRKVCTDAAKTDIKSEPALQLIIGDEQKVRLWVIDDAMFMQMLRAWEDMYG